MHPKQIESLWSDTVFQNAQREAFSTKMVQSPELTGIVGYYAGFAIYEDIIGIRGWDTTNDDMGFGTVSEMFDPTDVTDNYNAIVFGKSAVGRAVAKDLHFTNEVDDHENTIEIGGAMINGYSRNDWVTEAVAGDSSGGGASNAFSKGNATAGVANAISAINQSSLVLMTDETGS